MTHRNRQGVYILQGGPLLYVGSTAGGKGRSFDARLREHLRDLAQGRHANGALSRQYRLDGGRGWCLVVTVPTPMGNITLARLVESAVIRALGKGCCNERR